MLIATIIVKRYLFVFLYLEETWYHVGNKFLGCEHNLSLEGWGIAIREIFSFKYNLEITVLRSCKLGKEFFFGCVKKFVSQKAETVKVLIEYVDFIQHCGSDFQISTFDSIFELAHLRERKAKIKKSKNSTVCWIVIVFWSPLQKYSMKCVNLQGFLEKINEKISSEKSD